MNQWGWVRVDKEDNGELIDMTACESYVMRCNEEGRYIKIQTMEGNFVKNFTSRTQTKMVYNMIKIFPKNNFLRYINEQMEKDV